MIYLLENFVYYLNNQILKLYNKQKIQNNKDKRFQLFNIILSNMKIKIKYIFNLLKNHFFILINLLIIMNMINNNKKILSFLIILISDYKNYFHYLYFS